MSELLEWAAAEGSTVEVDGTPLPEVGDIPLPEGEGNAAWGPNDDEPADGLVDDDLTGLMATILAEHGVDTLLSSGDEELDAMRVLYVNEGTYTTLSSAQTAIVRTQRAQIVELTSEYADINLDLTQEGDEDAGMDLDSEDSEADTTDSGA